MEIFFATFKILDKRKTKTENTLPLLCSYEISILKENEYNHRINLSTSHSHEYLLWLKVCFFISIKTHGC